MQAVEVLGMLVEERYHLLSQHSLNHFWYLGHHMKVRVQPNTNSRTGTRAVAVLRSTGRGIWGEWGDRVNEGKWEETH